ncbi:septation protein SpoVG family protein [Intestinimonas butyriciproducens]|uniref:septation protein SpoVG family protein n=1 Tax=Intestinimonas butyriciproducens TaxID=1297617 RepID=UPI0018AA28A8|nr:septation protein SpoVG family protein [Intestinimonas butyriciproducens]MDB7815571.1 septation protein SpoVG family protein [Intestinimonas butyriciproducens]MDB7844636.1 septation protein SpoVG family protein [Intestinimonas butyriciproducens]MDB7856593.1 septation protein SpoVG family protein [Intestinimonas butyriciproducens]
MATTQTAAAPAPVVDEAAQEEMRRLLLEAPIAELAENQGISIDEAVALRVEQAIANAPRPVEVTVRPIEPQGKLIGFASVNFGGVVVDDFKVVNGKNGVFLGAPSKPDAYARSGYRSTARVMDRALQERLDTAAEGYSVAVEKLIARAEAVRPAPIREQMEKAAQAAAKENAARTAPAKGKEARDDR